MDWEKSAISIKIWGKRLYWRVRLLLVIGLLAVFVSTVAIYLHHTYTKIRLRFDLPAQIVQSPVYDEFALFAVGLVSLTAALLALKH